MAALRINLLFLVFIDIDSGSPRIVDKNAKTRQANGNSD